MNEQDAEKGVGMSSEPLKAHHKDKLSKNVLESANDWKVQFDLELDFVTSPKRAKASHRKSQSSQEKAHARMA